jgi:hypothetical protein
MGTGQSAELIREDVERTREDLGATAEALAHKADAPARAAEALTGAKDRVAAKASGAVRRATPDRRRVAGMAQSVKDSAERNPAGLVLGSVALGFLAGALMPATSVEQRTAGPVADELRGAAGEAAREVADAARPEGTAAPAGGPAPAGAGMAGAA